MPNTTMLPHGVAAPKQRRMYHPSQWSRPLLEGGGGGQSASSDLFGTGKFFLLILIVAIPSFLLGSTVSLYAAVDCSNISTMGGGGNEAEIEKRVEERVKKREEVLLSKHTSLVRTMVEQRLKEECKIHRSESDLGDGSNGAFSSSQDVLNPQFVGDMVTAMALTPKTNFTNQIELGVPLDKIKEGASHVLMLYGHSLSMPTSMQQQKHLSKYTVPEIIDAKEALENCEYLKVQLVDHSKDRKECLALVPQYESYHLQKWMRVPERSSGLHGSIDPKEPLRLVSRGLNGNAREEFPPPKKIVTDRSYDMLRTFLNSLDDVVKDLKNLIGEADSRDAHSLLKPYKDKAIIVMVCNFGQSELLMNFVCHARSKNFDTSAILVFATDPETEELAKSLGLAAYYDEKNFGSIPSEAAHFYGDKRFSAMMVAKIVCVQLISYLGYDILFQDVDILWYQHPLEDYFAKPGHWSQQFDLIFQDDGGHSVRYAPYSANSGFYYVRQNERTRIFLNSLLFSSDIIMETDSHQQAMIAVMSEHVSLYGLRIKVVSRDEEDLPGGYQWNMKNGSYMRAFFRGEIKPLIFHMSWTKNKENKEKYFQQMGAWHVHETCVGKKKSEIDAAGTSLVSTCCSAEAIFKCHYRDKPSLHPCKDSPPIDKGRPSFWK